MKIKSLFVAVLLMAGVVIAPSAVAANENPIVESFTFSPQEIDLTAADTRVTFEVVVSHPFGIENTSLYLILNSGEQSKLSLYLKRTDSPIDLFQKKVIFKGTINVPRDIAPGAYVPNVSPAKNNRATSYQYETGNIESKNFRTLVGAENALLIRNNGELNFEYKTFSGPTYVTSVDHQFKDKQKYNSSVYPIWKVGESYDPNDFFELNVPSLKLSTVTLSPRICTSDGTKLNFVATGGCSFKVLTPKTKDYTQKEYNFTAMISEARLKQELFVSKIENQTDVGLPKILELPRVYSGVQGTILPVSITPSVCIASTFFVKLNAPGKCSLTYQSVATDDFLASDLYTQSFEILKDGKVVVPTPVATPTPTPVATPTAKPVVKKTITCVKGKKTVKKTAVSPKCPAGYKLKK
jgi:hypothetical protein